MTLTLAITTYNRYEMLLESFANVIDDPRIDEILIMDDASESKYWDKIKELPNFNHKIKVVRQLSNRGMSVNKKDAVYHSKNEWVILFDSDNVVGKDYLDAFFYHFDYDKEEIYCPEFAKPSFDYRKLRRFTIDSYQASHMINTDNEVNMLLNTCNYVVNRDYYLNIWQENKEMKGSDTIWFAYLWLKAGYNFWVVPDMHYFHRVHDGSGFMQDANYNMQKAEEIKKMIMDL